ILLYPIFIPLLTSILLLFLWGRVRLQKRLSFIGNLAGLIAAGTLFYTVWTDGVQVIHSGNWKAPFGITFVADTLSVVLVLLTSVSGLLVGIFSSATIGEKRIRFGFFPIFHFLILGLSGSFLTGDIFNLYV